MEVKCDGSPQNQLLDNTMVSVQSCPDLLDKQNINVQFMLLSMVQLALLLVLLLLVITC